LASAAVDEAKRAAAFPSSHENDGVVADGFDCGHG
jgi:hypothetical protein